MALAAPCAVDPPAPTTPILNLAQLENSLLIGPAGNLVVPLLAGSGPASFIGA